MTRIDSPRLVRLLRSLVVTGVVAAAIVSPASGQRSWLRSVDGWVSYTYSNERLPGEGLRVRSVAVNPTSAPLSLPFSLCEKLKNEYSLAAMAIRCSEETDQLAPGDSAWAELVELSQPPSSRVQFSHPLRVPFVVDVEAEGVRPEIVEEVVSQGVLADRGFMPIPATRLGADALSTHSPYLDLRLTRDESGAFWVGICWRGAGGRVVQGECDTPSRSIFESSEFGVGAEVFTLVQRALQSYPRSPGL